MQGSSSQQRLTTKHIHSRPDRHSPPLTAAQTSITSKVRREPEHCNLRRRWTSKDLYCWSSGWKWELYHTTETLDLDTVKVRVYADPSTEAYDTYTNLNDATTLDKNSRIFVCKEAPNGQYELTLVMVLDLVSFEAAIRSKWSTIKLRDSEANGARTFTQSIKFVTLRTSCCLFRLRLYTAHGLVQTKRLIESVRKNAYLYAAQNRMVTAQDYALVLRKYSNVIEDIKSWGGEENIPPNMVLSISQSFTTLSKPRSRVRHNRVLSHSHHEIFRSHRFWYRVHWPERNVLEVSVFFQWNRTSQV